MSASNLEIFFDRNANAKVKKENSVRGMASKACAHGALLQSDNVIRFAENAKEQRIQATPPP